MPITANRLQAISAIASIAMLCPLSAQAKDFNGGRAEGALGSVGKALGAGGGAALGTLRGGTTGAVIGGSLGSDAGEALGKKWGKDLDKHAERNHAEGRGGSEDPRFNPSTLLDLLK
jgi:hypothetical protein